MNYVQAQGGQRYEHNNIPPRFEALGRKAGFDDVHVIFIDAVDNPGELADRADIREQALATAERIMKGERSAPFVVMDNMIVTDGDTE